MWLWEFLPQEKVRVKKSRKRKTDRLNDVMMVVFVKQPLGKAAGLLTNYTEGE